jgi:non-canonical poly(A) RNA polymerase PAPD5/7
MGDHYRPERGRPPPLADRMTFTGQQDSSRQSEFTFESNHPAPHFAPSGPANSGSRAPRRNRGGAPYRDSWRRDQPDSSHYGRNNTNGPRRGGFRKAAPHERALLQHRDGGSPEYTLGVSDGPNRFVDVDDLSNDEEAEMEVESDASAEIDSADETAGNRKIARVQSHTRADGNLAPKWAPKPEPEVSKWSNPDPYTALPPPNETTGVKRDVVQLIRKAKNQNAEKATANNAVAANDDFISFGDDDVADKDKTPATYVRQDDKHTRMENSGMYIHHDDESNQRPAKDDASVRPIEGSLNDVYPSSTHISQTNRGNEPPAYPSRSRKRKAGGEAAIIDIWLPDRRSDPTPWVPSRHAYTHLSQNPEKW